MTFAECQERYGSGGSGNISVIDLGMVSLRDAVLNGRNNVLIPYADGRLIKYIGFVPPLIVTQPGPGYGPTFWTPNTKSGFATATDLSSFENNVDTLGLFNAAGNQLATNLAGIVGGNAQILDSGPLFVMADPGNNGSRIVGGWQALTRYCFDDMILDSNGHLQQTAMTPGGIPTGGVSGASEPTWNDSGGNTTDGSITWFDLGLVTEGSIHVIAEVIEGVSPMPKRPYTLEFVSPPVNVVAGETMADITVMVKDQDGSPYTFSSCDISLYILGDGTLNGTIGAITDKTTGIATFSGLSITQPDTGYILRCEIHPVLIDPIFSDPFDVTAP